MYDQYQIGSNEYQEVTSGEYALTMESTVLTAQFSFSVDDLSSTFYSLPGSPSLNISKTNFYYPNLYITVVIGQYHNEIIDSVCSVFGSTAQYFVTYSNSSAQSWVTISPVGPEISINASTSIISPNTTYTFQISITHLTNYYTQNLAIRVEPCLINHCSICQSSSICRTCSDGYYRSLNSSVCSLNSSSDSTTHRFSTEYRSLSISIAITSCFTSIVSLSSPQGLWIFMHFQQMLLVLLLLRIYFPSEIIQLLRGLRVLVLSFNVIDFSNLPLFNRLIEWITFNLKSQELKHYDIK